MAKVIQDREYKNHRIHVIKDDYGYFDVIVKEIESLNEPVIASYSRISNEPHALFIGFAFVDGVDYVERCKKLDKDAKNLMKRD